VAIMFELPREAVRSERPSGEWGYAGKAWVVGSCGAGVAEVCLWENYGKEALHGGELLTRVFSSDVGAASCLSLCKI